MIKPVTKNREKINPRALQKSYKDRRERELTEQGMPLFEPDGLLNINEEYLSLPMEITEVPSKELGEYLNAFTQQKAYLRTLLGRIELAVEDSKRLYFESSEELYRKYSLDKISETAKDRIINASPKVKSFYHDYVDCKKKQTLVEYSISNIEDIIFMISREVTRRAGDFSDDTRNHNVGRM